jgi:hypothetical protein
MPSYVNNSEVKLSLLNKVVSKQNPALQNCFLIFHLTT